MYLQTLLLQRRVRRTVILKIKITEQVDKKIAQLMTTGSGFIMVTEQE